MTDHRYRRRVALLLAVPLVIAACSIPVDDTVNRVDEDDLRGLENTTTTTTTTTTTLPPPETTLVPPVTDPAATEPPTTTSSTLATATTPVTFYYTISNTELLQSLRSDIAGNPGPSLEQVVNGLQNPVADLAASGLQTAVRQGLITTVSVGQRAQLTVTLARDVLDSMSDLQKRRAIAQIVLTFTSFTTTDTGSIAFVSFLYNDGEAVQVPLPATGTPTTDVLAFDDFATLIAGATGSTTVPPTTPPTEPPTTSPPESTA